MEVERKKLIAELQETIEKIKTLKRLIPICAWCKRVRDDKVYWDEIETYIKKHFDTDFIHGKCPECLEGFQTKGAQTIEEKE